MIIKCFDRGPLGANMYLLWSEGSYFIVDPCCDPKLVMDCPEISDFDYKSLQAIFITHGHFDHIMYVDSWKSEFPDVPVFISDKERDALENPYVNGSLNFGYNLSCITVPSLLSSIDNRFVMNDEVTLRVLNTPGHSRGSVCYLVECNDKSSAEVKRYMFSGDMLFSQSVGRTDLPGGDTKQMKESIDLLRNITEDYIVLPGHGPYTSLIIEKKYNPYFS